MSSDAAASDRIRLHPSWKARLQDTFASPGLAALRDFLLQERQRGHTVYPPAAEIFAALDATPFEQVRVVLLGQDPYHGPGQAHGLSFSVKRGVDVPPSLTNIFRELQSDLSVPPPRHGDLSAWARQGVLLLNASLTVRAGQAASHADQGWQHFTDAVLRALDREREGLVFLLWGRHAQRKAAFLDGRRHLLLTAPHPSPLSAHAGFFGCRHFSRANAYLAARGGAAIDWRLPD